MHIDCGVSLSEQKIEPNILLRSMTCHKGEKKKKKIQGHAMTKAWSLKTLEFTQIDNFTEWMHINSMLVI